MKKFGLLFGLLLLIGGAGGYYLYNKPHENVSKARADFEMTATELFSAFEQDEAASNRKYLDKFIQVEGTVNEVKSDEEGFPVLFLDGGGMLFGVKCNLDRLTQHERTQFASGEKVVLKGICTGMLSDVVLDRCVEVVQSLN